MKGYKNNKNNKNNKKENTKSIKKTKKHNKFQKIKGGCDKKCSKPKLKTIITGVKIIVKNNSKTFS